MAHLELMYLTERWWFSRSQYVLVYQRVWDTPSDWGTSIHMLNFDVKEWYQGLAHWFTGSPVSSMRHPIFAAIATPWWLMLKGGDELFLRKVSYETSKVKDERGLKQRSFWIYPTHYCWWFILEIGGINHYERPEEPWWVGPWDTHQFHEDDHNPCPNQWGERDEGSVYCFVLFWQLLLHVSTERLSNSCRMKSGWWFGTLFIFPYIGNVIIPIDEVIFFRGVALAHQPEMNDLAIGCCFESHCSSQHQHWFSSSDLPQSLGFRRVIHRRRDFYQDIANDDVPAFHAARWHGFHGFHGPQGVARCGSPFCCPETWDHPL